MMRSKKTLNKTNSAVSKQLREFKKLSSVDEAIFNIEGLEHVGNLLEEDRNKDEREFVKEAASAASSNAIREAKALNLTFQYIQKGKIFENRGDGTVVELKAIETVRSNIPLEKINTICLRAKD